MNIKFLKVFLDSSCKSVVVPKEMEQEETLSITPQLGYVPNELIHHIQSMLPEKDAARTCVMSKSWLHAWYTMPTLRFTTCVTNDHLTKQEQVDYIKLIDRTLLRYLNNNMSIECLHLHLDIEKLSLPSPVEIWFQALASVNILKELSLTICGTKLARNTNEVGWLTIPNAIFSCENLNTIRLRADKLVKLYQVRMDINPVFKCPFLRILELVNVCISEGALHNLFSSCSLLEKIRIEYSQNLKNIKVKNLRCLRELRIKKIGNIIDDILEISDVPSLRFILYLSLSRFTIRMDTLRSVRVLYLFGMTVDNTFSNKILSKFPFLETLDLASPKDTLETIEITCASLTKMTLASVSNKLMNIQIYASKLLYFSYEGWQMPSLLFPSSTPAHIKLILRLRNSHPVDLSFFLKVREALDLSSNFDIEIKDDFVPLNIDLDDLRRMVPFPARNVQQLSFGKKLEKKLWKHLPLLDFLFSICYPPYVKAFYRSSNGKNYWYAQMVEMMEKKTCDLKEIEIKNPANGKSETLTNSWRSSHFLFELPMRTFINDEGNDYSSDEFKLNWWC